MRASGGWDWRDSNNHDATMKNFLRDVRDWKIHSYSSVRAVSLVTVERDLIHAKDERHKTDGLNTPLPYSFGGAQTSARRDVANLAHLLASYSQRV